MGTFIWVWAIFVAVVSILIFSRVFRNAEKKNEGFIFCYWKMSYRRKFIRTLWMIPVDILALIAIYMMLKSVLVTAVVGVLGAVMLAVQAAYTYRKWKEEEAAER